MEDETNTNMKDFLDKQNEMRHEMIRKLHNDSLILKQYAEAMTEAATSMTGAGYVTFIESRQRFYDSVNKIVADVELILLRL